MSNGGAGTLNDRNLRGKGEMMQEKMSKILVMTISVKEMGDINIYCGCILTSVTDQ